MIIVLAQASARPEHRDALAEALTRASVTSRNDPGCLAYSFHSDVEDANAFTSIERWENREDLDAHLATPHVAELIGGLQGKVTGPPVITVYEVSSSSVVG
ncbi:MAG: antibiotic biosynthesis monooxygenase [Geodermatophilaceae bacterium]|jgi:quinol monooxygenase YgiN|nr:antibiotic biosynthesis monooxygenase [Geodermatophilaceae bacterium]